MDIRGRSFLSLRVGKRLVLLHRNCLRSITHVLPNSSLFTLLLLLSYTFLRIDCKYSCLPRRKCWSHEDPDQAFRIFHNDEIVLQTRPGTSSRFAQKNTRNSSTLTCNQLRGSGFGRLMQHHLVLGKRPQFEPCFSMLVAFFEPNEASR